MKKVIVPALLFLLFLVNCSNVENNYFDKPTLEKIAQLSSIEPPPTVIASTPVYVVGSSDSISESNFMQLKEVYSTFYADKYSFFHDFLFGVLNQRIKVDTKGPRARLYYSQMFLIEPKIANLYKQTGIEGIINNYCIYSDRKYTLRNSLASVNEIKSISYFFFINKYIRSDDDYRATINFKKLSAILE